jgi:lauroyl/myristoyl acyltransferase
VTTPAPTRAERAADLGFAAAWRFVRLLPEPLARAAFHVGADLAVRQDGAGVRRLRGHLARVAPGADPDALVRDGMRSYARYWCEAFRLPAMDPFDVQRRMDPHMEGADALRASIAEGRGVVVALPHSGNWDVAGLWMVEEMRRQGRPAAITTVVERLRPEPLFRRFVEYRERLGFEVVAADGGRAAHRALTNRLRSGGVVCLVADRDLTGAGVDVTFFGERVRMPAGPAQLAALTGAALHPAFCTFTPDAWGARVLPAVPVPDRAAVPKAIQQVAEAFEQLIRRAPADWHMLQELTPARRRAS